jgi:hypothetical protein
VKLSDFTGQWPSLLQGSAQRVKITKFKTNPMDLTIGMHILTVKAPNADQKVLLACEG